MGAPPATAAADAQLGQLLIIGSTTAQRAAFIARLTAVTSDPASNQSGVGAVHTVGCVMC